MRLARQRMVAAALCALLAACASGIRESERPAELSSKFKNLIKVERLWKASAGNSAPDLRLGLSLALSGDTIYTANNDGLVQAFNKADGQRLWRTATRVALTGGPGAGEGLVVAGASEGQIFALDATTGEIRWQAHINSELLSAPAVGNGVVLVRAVDGRVVAFSASDGRQLWSAEQQVPRLSLRGTSEPVIAGEATVVAFDNGRVQALRLSDGNTLWDINLAPVTGRSELERLNDIDTALQVHGDSVYVVGFQGKLARISLEEGEIVWSRDVSSYSGLDVDDSGVYVTTADGSVMKVSLEGIEAWKTSEFAWRGLSPPGVFRGIVAVADFEGYVHFLDGGTGAQAARLHPLATRVSADPVVSDGVVFLRDDGGGIVALRGN
jgi:outer membrane protein assembly factor BamB